MFISETQKIRKKVSKYLNGKIYDIGCGRDRITPDAVGIDGKAGHLKNGEIALDGLSTFSKELHGTADVVFSSHALEHMLDDYGTLVSWSNLLKKGGKLILYLPDGDHYDNKKNFEHMRDYRHETFMLFFRRAFCGQGHNYRGKYLKKIFKVLEDGKDVGKDRYSFYLVAEKL